MQYGMGYVEFLSLKKEIEAMLSAGYRFAAIHRKLVSGKKITMSYTTFSRYVSGRYLKKEGEKDKDALVEHEHRQHAEKTPSDPKKSATAALPAVPGQASPPATAEQESAPARGDPRMAGVEKKAPFGQVKVDPDEIF